MDYVIESIVANMEKIKDENLFKMFERHGYRRNDVLKMISDKRISTDQYGISTAICVDGVQIFEIKSFVNEKGITEVYSDITTTPTSW